MNEKHTETKEYKDGLEHVLKLLFKTVNMTELDNENYIKLLTTLIETVYSKGWTQANEYNLRVLEKMIKNK